MSYLSNPTSKTNYGVTFVGDFINVTDGIISLDQDVSKTANVQFNLLDVIGNITSNGEMVITEVIPTAGTGIQLSDVEIYGLTAKFTISNSGVLSLSAGYGISLSGATGDITISSFGADLINTYGTTTSYTATLDDEYIGVNSTSAVTITLPSGVNGRVYTIKDEHGQGSGKITISPHSGEFIDNAVSYIISIPYQSVSLVFRANHWHII